MIDDFGMGHTSLLYLQSEYFDVVKLDGSLTRPLLKSHTNQKIVRSIIELGQELGVNVIAEFVENREQRSSGYAGLSLLSGVSVCKTAGTGGVYYLYETDEREVAGCFFKISSDIYQNFSCF